MNCAFHPEVENTAFCIRCGKALCASCVRQVQASVYCEGCLADSLGGNTGAMGNSGVPPRPDVVTESAGGASPEGAFFLGLIPGVGAIYNAEYFKALLHLLVFGLLVSIANGVHGGGEALFGLLAFGFYAYMPFEAYYTAKKRKLAREGISLITPFDNFNDQFGNMELWGGIALILLGGIFLLDNFEIVSMEKIGKFWPALLILAGVAFIRRFLKGSKA